MGRIFKGWIALNVEKCKDFKGFEFFMEMFFICSTGELRVFGFGINMVSSFFFTIYQFPHEYCFSYALKQRSEFLFPLEKNFLYKEFNFLTRILHTTVRGTFPNSNPVPIRLNKISLSLSSTCIQLRYLGDNFNSKNFTIDRILHSFDRKIYIYFFPLSFSRRDRPWRERNVFIFRASRSATTESEIFQYYNFPIKSGPAASNRSPRLLRFNPLPFGRLV